MYRNKQLNRSSIGIGVSFTYRSTRQCEAPYQLISISIYSNQGCPQVISLTGTHKKHVWVASRDAQKKKKMLRTRGV